MKLLVNGEYFALNGIANYGDVPEKCDDWDTDFGDVEDLYGDCGKPSFVDLRPMMTPVENQGSVGSCTANAVAGAYEYLCNVRAKQVGDTPGDISRLFIYYVARKAGLVKRGMGHMKVTDSGSSIATSIDILQKKGACLADTHPYIVDRKNERPPEEAYDEALGYKISKSWKLRTDLNQFRDALSRGYPIIFGCRLYESFSKAGRNPRMNGWIPMPSASESQAKEHGLHAMLIVGYSDQHQCFIVRNSWGERWGYHGYCFMPYDYVASSYYNLGDNFVIYGLTDYDFTPDASMGMFDEEEAGVPSFDEGVDYEEDDGEEFEFVEDEEEEEEEDDDDGFDEETFLCPYAEARRVFEKFDIDGSGYMSSEEIASALQMNGQFITDEYVEEILEQYGDDDGQLSFSEFLEICQIETKEECCDEEEDKDTCSETNEEEGEMEEEEEEEEEGCEEEEDECEEEEEEEEEEEFDEEEEEFDEEGEGCVAEYEDEEE